ncbi:hypothetical protein N5079_09465 [Planotetraspora sp. A-T 1434]|uniref:hypothetical protein n=1 Tax=Planotetraspora sp. A-T 1434 TaxID=2979219 RepID=UPI0021BE51E3|nr:hypothetical protein [Planotetraspora sp. A-T 1434]MCT9930443.1 hypothetical protein [Planotetraspora sp. A-T 1434]
MKNNPYDNRYGTTEQPTPETPEPLEEEARREEALAGSRHDAHEGPGPVYSAGGADLDDSRYTGESGYADGREDTRNAESDSPGTWVAGSGVTAHTADSRTSQTAEHTADSRTSSRTSEAAEDTADIEDTADTADGRTVDRRSGDGAYVSEAPGDRTFDAGTVESVSADRTFDAGTVESVSADRTFDAEAVESVPAPRTGDSPAARESLEPVDARDDVLAPDLDGRTATQPKDVESPSAESIAGSTGPGAESTTGTTRPDAEPTAGSTRPGADPATGTTRSDAESTTGDTITGVESTAAPGIDAETASSESLAAAEAAPAIDFDRRWHEIKAGFVDDPRSSVEQADALVEEAVAVFTTRRQALLDRWKNRDHNDSDHNDTEALRLALRDYYALLLQLTGK